MTLLEVMISVAIILSMSAIVAQSLANSIEFNEVLSMRDTTARTARVALAKLKRDLQMAYLTPNRTLVDRYQTVFVGLDESPDRLFFSTLNHQRMYLNTRESDQAEISVWTEPSPKEQGYGSILYIRESPRIDQYPDEDGKVLPLAYNVRSFEVKYLAQVDNAWKDDWDTRSADTPYFLPRAVQIGLVLIASSTSEPGETEDVPFLTIVELDYAPRLPRTGASDVAAAEAAGAATVAGQASIFDFNKFNRGGFGGTGAGGLSSGLPSTSGSGSGKKGPTGARAGAAPTRAPTSPADAMRQGGVPEGMIPKGLR
jgi:general secretion pathway protein J